MAGSHPAVHRAADVAERAKASGEDLLSRLDNVARGWAAWAGTARDVGAQTATVLRQATATGPVTADGVRRAEAQLHARTGRTGGNGSLVRTAPVALAFLHDAQSLAHATRAVSELDVDALRVEPTTASVPLRRRRPSWPNPADRGPRVRVVVLSSSTERAQPTSRAGYNWAVGPTGPTPQPGAQPAYRIRRARGTAMSTWHRGITVAGVALLLAGCSAPASEPEASTPPATRAAPSTEGATSTVPPTEAATTPYDDGAAAVDQAAALDAFVAEQQASVPQIMEMSPGTYSAITIEGTAPATIEVSYVYTEQTDPATVAGSLNQMIPTLQTMCDTVVFVAMDAAGISASPTVVYTYLNPDGSEVWSHTFVPA